MAVFALSLMFNGSSAETQSDTCGLRKDATGLPAPPFRVEQTYAEGERHAGLEHVIDRGPEPRLPLRTCSSRSSDVTVETGQYLHVPRIKSG
jgi:hypothetical protein